MVPDYLKNRPQDFVSCCLQRLSTAEEISPNDVVSLDPVSGLFKVKSHQSGTMLALESQIRCRLGRNLPIWNIPNESIYSKGCEYAIIFGVTPLRGKLSGKVIWVIGPTLDNINRLTNVPIDRYENENVPILQPRTELVMA